MLAMLKKAAVWILLCVSIASWSGCGSTSSHYVYATLSANEVAAYREDPNSGILTPISGSPFATGTAPQAVVVHPSRKFAYVANAGENDISLFTVGSSGALTEVLPRSNTTGSPNFMAIDPPGSFLYVASSSSNSISSFSISSSSGALTLVSGSPFPIGVSPISLKLAPSGNVLFIGSAGSPGSIASFSVSAGSIAVAGSSPAGGNPFGLAVDSGGSFLYVANTLDNSISTFSIGATGALTEIAGSPVGETLTAAPVALLVDPSGKHLFVANEGSNNIAAYTISSGALTVLTNSPFGGVTSPNSIVADPSGKYLLVESGASSGAITVFRLDPSTGTLSAPASYSPGGTPTSITAVP